MQNNPFPFSLPLLPGALRTRLLATLRASVQEIDTQIEALERAAEGMRPWSVVFNEMQVRGSDRLMQVDENHMLYVLRTLRRGQMPMIVDRNLLDPALQQEYEESRRNEGMLRSLRRHKHDYEQQIRVLEGPDGEGEAMRLFERDRERRRQLERSQQGT